MEVDKTISGMERINNLEQKVAVLKERTENFKDWLEKIEKKVDHLIWKFAGANALLGLIIIIILKMWK